MIITLADISSLIDNELGYESLLLLILNTQQI